MKWISVKDRLPEVSDAQDERFPEMCKSDFVLVATGYGNMAVARFETDVDDETGDRYCIWNMPGIDVVEDVTHWMPLPEPPKE